MNAVADAAKTMVRMFKTKPEYVEIDSHKLSYNVGCLLDIPTGTFVKGKYGENILNGGMAALIGFAGRGNSYKTMLVDYMTLTMSEHIAYAGYEPYTNKYDTEVNVRKDRLHSLLRRFPMLTKLDALNSGIWMVTDKSKHLGDDWFKLLKDFLNGDKYKNRKDYLVLTPMLTDKGVPVKTVLPTNGTVDSLTDFQTSDIIETEKKNDLGEGGRNMIHARGGLVKANLLAELPVLCAHGSHYLAITAQVGKTSTIGLPTHGAPPPKKLQHMPNGQEIKGVSDKLFYLTSYFFFVMNSVLLNDKESKSPIFPKVQSEDKEPSEDLNLITVKQLRSKVGPSGFTLDIIASQTEGILPTLTEFFFLKENDKFGIGGTNINFFMDLLPDVKLMRTTVREKIDNDPELVRAIEISADLLQIKQYHSHLDLNIPTPAELYEKLKTQYDWKVLLNTRRWWTFNNDQVGPNFLSTMDLIEMYNDRYVPYWLKK